MEVLTNILHSSIRMAAPLLLAAMGGLFTHQANVLNIALDGIMLIGAFTGVVVSLLTGNVFLAVLIAVISGVLVGLLFSFFSITKKGNFIIIGLAVNIFAVGITAYILRTGFGTRGVLASEKIVGLDKIHFEFLEKIPFFGDILNNHTPLVYFSLLSILLVHIILYKTIYGLRLRSVGEKPEAALALGLKVDVLKYSAVLISGVFSALAGVNLALENINMFVEDMTSGRGFIALAAIFCGKGTPVGAAVFSFLFGVADAVQMRLQGYGIPGNFIQMIPFIFIVVVLTVIGIIKRSKSLQRSDTLV